MIDYSEPIVESSNYYSVKVYIKGDCKIKRIKTLSYVFSTGRKGMGESDQQESVNKIGNTQHQKVLIIVC